MISLILVSSILAACGAPTPTPKVPTPTATPNVQIFHDLVHVESLQQDPVAHKLDMYRPGRPGTWPVILFIHGLGATKQGLRKESSALAESSAVVFTPDWPTMLVDIAAREDGEGYREMYEVLACAIRFAQGKAGDYGGDPAHMTFVGFSYGAAYGSWMALAGDNLDQLWEEFTAARGGPPSQVECVAMEGSLGVDALTGIGGRYNAAEKLQKRDAQLWKIVSPFAHVGRGPMLRVRLLHGERDRTVPPELSVQMNDLLAGSRCDTKLILFDGIHRVPIDLTAEVYLDLLGE